ncbi:MAG TPA: exosortase H [Methylomirabilota bacterium]|nr:exosortase H [Methylomirabilota bacterium]
MNRADRLRLFLRRQRAGIRFCALFALFTVLGFAIIYAAQNVLVVPLNRHLAWMTEKSLRLVGAHASSSGPAVALSGFAVEIRNNCNAIYEVGLYEAAVWAYPASLRDRLIGTLVGAGVLYVVNFVRILTLLALGVLQPSWFEATHLYVWQVLFLLVAATCWIGWVSRIRPVA